MTSEQLRAARALVRWEQKDVAKASGVSLPTIARIETKPGKLSAYDSTVEAIRKALESAGVEFIPPGTSSADGGAGVRLRAASGG